MNEQKKEMLDGKVKQARKSTNLIVKLDSCDTVINHLESSVPFAAIYEHALVVTSSYGNNKGGEKYSLILSEKAMQGLLDNYKLEREDILNKIDKEIQLDTTDFDGSVLSISENIKVISSPIKEKKENIVINITVNGNNGEQAVKVIADGLKRLGVNVN